MAKFGLAGFLIALAAFAAGCGSSGSSGSSSATTSGPVTKTAFIKQADAECDKGNREQSAAVRAYTQKGEGNAETIVKTIMLPHIRENAERLAEMETPPGDAGKVKAIATAVEQGVEKAEEENLAALQKTSHSPFAKGTKLATEYGFKVCGRYG